MGLKRTDEFRQDAVRIALTSGLTRKQVADDLGVGMSTLNKWIEPVPVWRIIPTITACRVSQANGNALHLQHADPELHLQPGKILQHAQRAATAPSVQYVEIPFPAWTHR